MFERMRWLGLLLVLALLMSSVTALLPEKARADDEGERIDQYTTRIIDKNNNVVYRVVTPGSPPPEGYVERAMAVPGPNPAAGTNTLTAPAYTWVYGCGAASAGMMAGYYDRQGYTNIYTGSTNGGVAPLNNDIYWTSQGYPATCGQVVTCGRAPFIASMNGLDGRATRGHVDDYWQAYNCTGDPYTTGGGWAAHADDCVADFIGTSQWTKNGNNYGNTDGSTGYFFAGGNAPLYDYTGCEPGYRDFSHGLRLFFESRGYTVTSNYSQPVNGYLGNPAGFTFAQYKAEIDAGRPVILIMEGHYMLGVGYNDSPANTVYFHNTWGHTVDSMTWGGVYAPPGYTGTHLGVIVLQLAPACTVPGAPALSSPGNGASAPGASVILTWLAATGSPTRYYLEVNSSNSWGAATRKYYADVGNVLTKTVTGMPNDGTTYYWRVWGGNACGWCSDAAANANKRSFTNGACTVPGAPALSSPGNGASAPGASVMLTWLAATGSPTRYWLEVNSSNSWGAATRKYYADVGNVLTKTVTGMPGDGTTYYWRVWGGNACGWCSDAAANANKRSFINTCSAPPGAPTLSSPTQGASVPGTTATFTWNTITGATKYWLEVNSSNGWGAATRKYYADVGGVTSKQVTTLPNNSSTLYWRVWGGNACGWCSDAAANANKRSFTNTCTAPPGAPTLSSPGNGTSVPGTSATFTWNTITGATKYYLEVNSSNSWGAATRKYYADVGNVLTKTVTGMPGDGTTYYWRVWGGNACGWCSDAAANANKRSFTNTCAAAPGAPTLSSPAQGAHVPGISTTFTWNTITGATKYYLEVNSSNIWGYGTRIFYAGVSGTSQFVCGLPTDGSTLYWRVWGGNNCGWCSDAAANANKRSFVNGP